MTYEMKGAQALDYRYCHYGTSRLAFRGPQKALTGPYAVFLGGTETFGRFVERPYPALLEPMLGVPCVNLGLPNSGIDAYLRDPEVLEIVRRACFVVVQATGVQFNSNRYYTVHPRRNDRVIGPTPLMRQVFRETDFTEFNFTRHLVLAMAERAPDRFDSLLREMQSVWVERMRQLLSGAKGVAFLLWFSEHVPAAHHTSLTEEREPWGVDRSLMTKALVQDAQLLEVVPSPRARALGTEGMVFTPLDLPATVGLPGPAAHREAADIIAAQVRAMEVLPRSLLQG